MPTVHAGAQMAAWTLAEARVNLAAWLAAEAAVATTGQEYRIGGMTLTRADARTIAERVTFWQRQVNALESTSGGRILRRRLIPRDT